MDKGLLDDGADRVIREHAEAVGLLCIYTATLDGTIVNFIGKLLESDEKTTACLVGSLPDLSQRAETAKRLAILRGPTQPWKDCVAGLLNLIQNGVGPKRNRYVHDDWMVHGEKMMRIDRRVKTLSPEAYKPPQIYHISERVTNAETIAELTSVVAELILHITFLGLSFAHWKKTGQIQEPPAQAVALSAYKFPNEKQPKLK
jgi:hypothetical protein